MDVLADAALEQPVWCFGCKEYHALNRFANVKHKPHWVCRGSAFNDRGYCRKFGNVPEQCNKILRHFIGEHTYSRDVMWTLERDIVQRFLQSFEFAELNDVVAVTEGRNIVAMQSVTTQRCANMEPPIELWGRAAKLF